MDRRRFLGLSGLGALASIVPSRAVAPPAGSSVPDVREAFRRARGAGKPLLVLVAPENAEPVVAYGRRAATDNGASGALFFRHGSERALASSMLCEVVAAPLSRVSALADVAAGPSEPLFVLLDGLDEDRAVATRIEAAPALADARLARDASIDARIRAISDAIDRAVHADDAQLVARARRASAVLALAERDAIERAVADLATLPDAIAARGAALLLSVAARNGRRAAAETRLAQLARERFEFTAPPGASWRLLERALCPKCGKAALSERARRVLDFDAEPTARAVAG